MRTSKSREGKYAVSPVQNAHIHTKVDWKCMMFSEIGLYNPELLLSDKDRTGQDTEYISRNFSLVHSQAF